MIALHTAEAIDTDAVRVFFQTVKTFAPSGVMMTLAGNDNGVPKRVALVHQEADGEHRYVIPLTRALTPEEVQPIVDAFAEACPDLDFDIEASTAEIASAAVEPEPTAEVDAERYHNLCVAWARRQHDAWVAERQAGGWRYGTQMSMSQKTHPLLKPFDQLPDEFRKVDIEEPQMLLDLLNSQGFAVITQDELKSLLALMR
jgi:hypothetical protein